MNWKNLKTHDCPQCFAPLKMNGTLLDMEYTCSKLCGFKIGEPKFNEIMKSMLRPRKNEQEYADYLSDLNNLGRAKVSKDFSDSPSLHN